MAEQVHAPASRRPARWSSELARVTERGTRGDPAGAAAGAERGSHPFVSDALVGDDALAALIEEHTETASVYRMGTDPEQVDWNYVDSRHCSGPEVLDAVGRSRLWINIVGVNHGSSAWADVSAELVADIEAALGEPLSGVSLNVLVSSPGAQVYYHADTYQTLLFHARGRKRVWTYPSFDARVVDLEALEEVFWGRDEDLPYRLAYDQYAQSFDLEPGDVVAWPAVAPHRVLNLDGINVSASFNFWTPQTRRLETVMRANHYLRKRLGVRNPRRERPAWRWAATKTVVAGVRRIRPLPAPVRLGQSDPTWTVDLSLPEGVRALVPTPA